MACGVTMMVESQPKFHGEERQIAPDLSVHAQHRDGCAVEVFSNVSYLG